MSIQQEMPKEMPMLVLDDDSLTPWLTIQDFVWTHAAQRYMFKTVDSCVNMIRIDHKDKKIIIYSGGCL